MDAPTNRDLSFDRTVGAIGHEEGYELWFDLPATKGDATTPELQTLCQGAILLGRIAEHMGWDWSGLLRHVEHISAPVDGYFLIEVGSRVFNAEQFRHALHEVVPASGLDPYKVKVVDADNANIYVLGHGLPPI